MSYPTQGKSLLSSLLAWISALVIMSIAAEILITELVRWLTILAPWALLSGAIVAVAVVTMGLIRRRFYSY